MVLSVSDGGPSPRSDLGASEAPGSTLGSRKRSAKARLAVVGGAPPNAPAGADDATAEMVARMLEAQQKAHRQQIETMERRLESMERSVRGASASSYQAQQLPHQLPVVPSAEQASLGPPAAWSVHDTAVWLRQVVQLPDLASMFVQHAVDGETLLELEPSDFAELGVRSIHRPRLQAALDGLRSAGGGNVAARTATRYRVDRGGSVSFRHSPRFDDRTPQQAEPGDEVVVTARHGSGLDEWVQHTNGLWLPLKFLVPDTGPHAHVGLARAPVAQAPVAQPSVPTPAPPIDFTQGAGLMIKQIFDAFDRDADGVLSQSEYDVFCTVTEGVGCDPDRWIRHCVSLKIPSEVGIPLRQFARLYLDDELRRHQGRQQHVRRFHPLPLLPAGLSHVQRPSSSPFVGDS